MATIYKFEVEIISDYCTYADGEIKVRLEEYLNKTDFIHDEKNGLGLRVNVTQKEEKQ